MSKILLDNIHYSTETGLISNVTAYSYDKEQAKIELLGRWERKDIIENIKRKKEIYRAVIRTNAENNYIADTICAICIVEIDGNVYLKHTDYVDESQKDDMIEFNRALKNHKLR